MTHNPIRPWRNIDRRKSRQIMVGHVPVGGDAPITVQTMTKANTVNIRTALIRLTLQNIQILLLNIEYLCLDLMP